MKVINRRVEHRRYDAGTVFALKGRKVYVAFDKLYGDMAFPYSGVSKENMKLVDPDMMEELLEDIGQNAGMLWVST